MDLEQLRAALDEDERVALAAIGVGNWFCLGVGAEAEADRFVAHVQRQTPERVLRWVKAVREILAEHQPTDGAHGGTWCDLCHGAGLEDWPCPTVRSLISVYGDTDGQ
jgi:hypothetical protein